MAHGLSDELVRAMVLMAQEYRLERLILFGSRARGSYRPASDVDLAASGGDVLRFALALEEEAPTLLSFDVVDLDGQVQRALRDEIERDGVVLYEKD